MDPLRFQALCRDLLQTEPEFTTAEVYGTPGQRQRGVDVIATQRNGSGIGTGQCKCVEPASFTAKLVKEAANEFFEHLEYWLGRGAQRFVLFVGADASETKILEASLQQGDRFRERGIRFELWSASVISNKLRPQPGIVRTYLGESWQSILCGEAVTGFQSPSVVIPGILETQLEALAVHVAHSAEEQLEHIRNLWRRGNRREALAAVLRLQEPTQWQTFSKHLKAQILRLHAQFLLDTNLALAKDLANQAGRLDPEANHRLLALIARAEGRNADAMGLVQNRNDVESSTLYAALLMESGDFITALSVLDRLESEAEVCRLRASAFLFKKDFSRARLEIEKGMQLSPDWRAMLFTHALVYYLSAIVPAALASGIPEWPEPEDWVFVRTDDDSRRFLRKAAVSLGKIENQSEEIDEERTIIEIWHLAALANDPEQRDDATAYCAAILAREKTHYRALIWAVARKLEVDLQQSVSAIRNLVEAGNASPGHVLALVVWHITQSQFEIADELLRNSKDSFASTGSKDIWSVWKAQLDAARGDRSSGELDVRESQMSNDLALVKLRAEAHVTQRWEELLAHLRSLATKGSPRAVLELCSVLASLKRWSEAEPFVHSLVEEIGTAEVVRMGATILFRAGKFEPCFNLIELNRGKFPHLALPAPLLEIRIACERELGQISPATAHAEEVFRTQPSKQSFLMLTDLYFRKGDFAALALVARKHEQFEELQPLELLVLAMRVGDQDNNIAAELWRRANRMGISDEQVPLALNAGYNLGLDSDLRPLVERLGPLSASGKGLVKSAGFDEVRAMLLSRRDQVEKVYRLYREGAIPVQLLSDHLNRSLVHWYHRAFHINESAARPQAGPTFLRHGRRYGQSIKVESSTRLQLHADSTALMTAWHLGILGHVERMFGPIRLPHDAVVALTHIRESAKPNQPARKTYFETVDKLANHNAISIEEAISEEQDIAAAMDLSALSVHSAQLVKQVVPRSWLLADYLPMLDKNGHPVSNLPSGVSSLLRTPHALVDALANLGDITNSEQLSALNALGLEVAQPVVRDVLRDSHVLCSAVVLEQIAASGMLSKACGAFKLHVLRTEFESGILAPLNGIRVAEEDSEWIRVLIEHLMRGIDAGRYTLLSRPDEVGLNPEREDSPPMQCLLELLAFPGNSGDVIWVDDRYFNGFLHRDGIPIIDTVDLLHLLCERSALKEDAVYDALHRLREGDARFLALEKKEIQYLVKRAPLENSALGETRELRTLRRHYARSLREGTDLRVVAAEQEPLVEWPFLLNSGSAAIDAISELWADDEGSDLCAARAGWILGSLYVPDRGRSFVRLEETPEIGVHMEALALAGLICHAIVLTGLSPKRRDICRRYLEWVWMRLVRRRFDSDNNLKLATLQLIKSLLLGGFPESSDPDHRQARKLLISIFLENMPQELSSALIEDIEFISKLSIEAQAYVNVGPHRVKADALWTAAVEAVQTGRSEGLSTDNTLLLFRADRTRQPKLEIEDRASATKYILYEGPLEIFSSELSEIEKAARALISDVDLGSETYEQEVARITQIPDPGTRLMELGKLRENSAAFRYRQLQQKVSQGLPVEYGDLLQQPASIAHFLRLQTDSATPASERLEEASARLLADVGIEQSLIRFSSIPHDLPGPLIDELRRATPEARYLLFKRLQIQMNSPIARAHMGRLLYEFQPDRGSYRRYGRLLMRTLVLESESVSHSAWLILLRYAANKLADAPGFRMLSIDARLCIVWSLGDRLFRTLSDARVDNAWIVEHFRSLPSNVTDEILFPNDAFYFDATHPARLSTLGLALAAAAYATNGCSTEPILRQESSAFLSAEPSRIVPMLADLKYAPDALGSIMRRSGRAAWTDALSGDVQDVLSSAALQAQIAFGLQNIESGRELSESWTIIHAIIRDLPVPDQHYEGMRRALQNIDLVRLWKDYPSALWVAALFASQHAAQFGDDVLLHLRAELKALAVALAENESADQSDSSQLLLSAAFELYRTATTTQPKFWNIVDLFEELIFELPSLVAQCQQFVDNLIEELPSSESRVWWRLQVKLRAIR